MSLAERDLENSELVRRLSRVDRRLRWLSVAGGLGRSALVVSLVVAVALAVDALWEAPLVLRVALLGLALLAALGGILWVLGRVLLRPSDMTAIAALIEAAHPELQERLSSAIELYDPQSANGSPLMRALVRKQAEQGVSCVSPGTAAPAVGAARRGLVGAAVLLALLAPSLFSGGYRLLLQRFVAPWDNLDRASNLYFRVSPGDATIARGSDVEIAAAPMWRLTQTERPDAVWLRVRDADGRSGQRRMTWREERGAYLATATQVLQPFDFDVWCSAARSRAFHIAVVERPALSAITATIEPPAYSGRPVQQIDGAVGEMQMLAGSRLSLQMKFNKPLDRSELLWWPDESAAGADAPPEIVPATLHADRRGAELELVPTGSGRFALRLADEAGIPNAAEPLRRVRIVPDAAPRVRFTDAGGARQVSPREVLRFPVQASDDIGVAALELHFAVEGAEQTAGVFEVDRALLGRHEVQTVLVLDLKPLELAEGAVLSVRARAADERPVPGPNEAWTEPRLLTVTSQADPYESDALAERHRQLSDELERLRAAVADSRTTAQALQAESAETDQAAAERDARAAELAAAEQALIGQAERLAALIEQHPLLQEPAESTRDLARGPLASAARHAEQARSAPAPDKPREFAASSEQLAQAEQELEALKTELARLAELERDLLELQRLADDTERLASDVADLQREHGAAAEADVATPAARQQRATKAERLRQEHGELTERLQDLLDRRSELLDSALLYHLGRLSAAGERARSLANSERTLAAALEQESESPSQPAEDRGSSNSSETDRSSGEAAAAGDASAVDQPDGMRDGEEAAAVEAMLSRQLQLLQRAVRLASDREEDDDLSEAAQQMVARAAEATGAAAAGDLVHAAKAAKQAAEQALAASSERPTTSQGEWQKLAEAQQDAARQFASAAASPGTRAAAQAAGERRLLASTQELQRELADVAEQLAAAPLNHAAAAARASGAQDATQHAQTQMESSSHERSRGEYEGAAAAARQAAAELDEAAARAGSQQPPSNRSAVPGEVGQQVARASRQLQRAAEQLAGEPESTAASEGQAGAETADASPPAEEASPADDSTDGMTESIEERSTPEPGSQTPETGDARDAASELQQAAAALQAAARGLKPATPGDGQRPGGSKTAAQPGRAPPDGDPSGLGTAETAGVSELAARLKARSMRNWGELPGELQSEVQNRSQKRPDGEYAPLIRLYFDEISRRQSPQRPEAP